MIKTESIIQRLKTTIAKIDGPDNGPWHWEGEFTVTMTAYEIDLLIKVLEFYKAEGKEYLPKPTKTIYTLDNTSDIIE